MGTENGLRAKGPMRRVLFLALASAACAGPAKSGPELRDGRQTNVASARELDRLGVRSFLENRFADAVLYFRAAHGLGGPPSELWNIARCEERKGDAEAAAAALDEYVAEREVSAADRDEAAREALLLRSRSSMLTVTTRPTGATVLVDGRRTAGTTPLSIEVAHGAHTLVVQHPGHPDETREVEARFGRPLIVQLDLERAGK